ncbi:MAG: type II secretion system protein [Pirellulales bacterium]|nr:type II secretion system protein [Pirellulales bacterium]
MRQQISAPPQAPRRRVSTSSSAHCPLTTDHSPAKGRRAFTLVEMLAVVAIIAILASVLLGALFLATERARHERTRSLINKLHNQMMQRWEEYESRRMPLVLPPNLLTSAQSDPTVLDSIAQAQLIFLYETMRMELPDMYEDLNLQYFDMSIPNLDQEFHSNGLFFDWQNLPAGIKRPDNHLATPEQEYVPAITRAYQLRVLTAAAANADDPTDMAQVVAAVKALGDANTSAEMLYLIMTTATGDEDSGGVHFSQKDIGDTDGDGMPEFIDAWGKPLRWIRWPSGYVNDPAIVGLSLLSSPWGLITDLISGIAADNLIDPDPNPFDPRPVTPATVMANSEPGNLPLPSPPQVLKQGYRLAPLIMSAGPDGEFGIRFDRDDAGLSDPDRATLISNYTDPYYWWIADGEYVRRGTPGKLDIATGAFSPTGEWVHLDNITNHLTEAQ